MFTRCVIFVYNERLFHIPIRWYGDKYLPLVSCKRTQLNYRGEGVKKHKELALASSGWNHKGSKGDYFTINSKPSKESEIKQTFESLGLTTETINALSDTKITAPTTIQKRAIPIILSGKNSIIAAQTGCGKTLAYLLPLLQQIKSWKTYEDTSSLNSPSALIISPNRVLASQIAQVAQPFCDDLSLKLECITGGHMKRFMLQTTMKEVDLVVASFGALSKLVTNRLYNVQNVHHVVLDEADTLLDDSFYEKLAIFLKKVPFQYQASIPPSGSQLTLVSATMPTDLPTTLSSFIDIESLVKVSNDYLHKMLPNVKQAFLRMGKSQKPLELLKVIRSDVNCRLPVMIFANKTSTSNWISLFLNENGIKCINLNSQMPVEMRMAHFDAYNKGEVHVLSCTDIGSRGLDTTRTKHILNYDFPLYIADYIHRCGRTGRLGSPAGCRVTNFVSSRREIPIVQNIEKSIRKLKNLPNVQGNITKIIYGSILDNPESDLAEAPLKMKNKL